MNISNRSMTKRLFQWTAVCVGMLAFWSCSSPYTAHEYRDFAPDNIWHYDSVAVFDFTIDNTAPTYDISYHLRNTREYPYYNLYTQCTMLDAEGKIVRQKQDELYLMHPQTGAPLGNGKSMYDHEVVLWEKYQFEKPGKYQFRVSQNMRLDSLEGVTSVGFSILPVEAKK